MEQKFLLPPFSLEDAIEKIQRAEDAWNSRNPEKISKAYSKDSEWRNRDTFVNGREEIVAFLTGKWEKELNYKLKKEYWAHTDNRTLVSSFIGNITEIQEILDFCAEHQIGPEVY